MDMETEDLMWKQIYTDLVKRQESGDFGQTEHELRLQQLDGGFFEKFGSLFRESNERAIEVEKAAPLNQEAKKNDDELSSEADGELNIPSDSESEEQKDNTDFIAVAFNIDELYSEVLYEILHNVGCDVSYEIGQTALFSYVQDAFKIPNDKHQNLLKSAEEKEAPEILLNVEVIEAKDLAPKDSNGLSDPFVTLYLTSNSSHRYNTSVKTTTLNPIWEEHFALPAADNTNEDSLCLEVWDFDPAESVKEKLGKIFEVKGVKGIRKLVKEIAVTAATGQHENELIGRARIPLNTIPASGMTMWYSLDKKNKITRQGLIKIRVSFSSEKNNLVAEQEHRNLLRIILLHELETSKVAPHWWCDSFSPQGKAILTQHIAQSGLTPTEVAICEWAVYANIHQNHALSFALFDKLLDQLVKPLQSGSVSEEDVKIFWDATKKLLPSCFAVIRKIRKKTTNEKTMMKTVSDVLKIISKLLSLDIPEKCNLFPANLYPWISDSGDEPHQDIQGAIRDAVKQGALNWFNHILENNNRKSDTDIHRLQNLIQIVQLVRSDLQKAMEFYDKLFQSTVHFQYPKVLYVFYQEKIASVAEPEVSDICKSLKKLSFTGNNLGNESHKEPLTEGTTLFELYLALQRFVMLGNGMCPGDNDFSIKNFHIWFHGGVAQWLDIAVYKALQRIEKAVELDTLQPVSVDVKYSSSAVDTLTIFHQVKIFWQQLNWPDVEGCYTFIAKIIDDICRCCVFYAERMSERVDGMGQIENIYENKFEVTNEWCLSINNIDYIRQCLEPFTQELGMQDVIKRMSDLKSPLEAERCQHTLNNVIANAIDTVRNEIIELLETVVSKMAPAMKRLLIEGAELFNQDSNSVDRLMAYVDNNLSTLHRELNEENFDRILQITWTEISKILEELIQSNLEKRRPPSFFSNLHKTLNLMLGSFKNPNDYSDCDALKRTEELLRLNGLETPDLIHEAHLDLMKQWEEFEESQYGELSVRFKFSNTTLFIEIMNARDLLAMDSNGSKLSKIIKVYHKIKFSGQCDPFVRVHFLPEDRFSGITKPKTQAHSKNRFPLFDEVFEIALTDEQRKIENGLILFSVKDKDLLGYNNQYIAEAFVSFSEIPDTDSPLNSLPQVHLKLFRPTTLDNKVIKAIEHRQGDKLAKEFLKKYKQRMGS